MSNPGSVVSDGEDASTLSQAVSKKSRAPPSVEVFVGYPKQKETNALLEVQAIRDSGRRFVCW